MKTWFLLALFASVSLTADCAPNRDSQYPPCRVTPPVQCGAICGDLGGSACEARRAAVHLAVLGTVQVFVTRFSHEDGAGYYTGTGFILDERGYVLTAEHVVDDAAAVFVRPRELDKDDAPVWHRGVPMQIVAASPEHDAALLAPVVGEKLPAPMAWSADRLAVRDPIWQVGCTTRWSWGTVTNTDALADGLRPLVHADANVDHGDSGGPLLDAEGRARGILARMTFNGSSSYWVPLPDALKAVGYKP